MTDTTKSDPTLKTRYLRDPKNQERVVTLVTKVQGNTVTFAVAVNTPPRTLTFYPNEVVRTDGDRFQRKTGSMIAHGRLTSKKATSVTFDPATMHPYIVALQHLAGVQGSVARIARTELQRINEKGGLPVSATRAA
jgi:hypothetical protein